MNSSISKYKPFFEAKFIIPRSKDTDVLKSNVFSLLNLFTKYKLIFIGAPAGFGKTNSLSNWIKSQNLTDNVIWISLDTDDNDPSSFFFHFIKAFDSIIKNNYTANNLKDPYEIEYSLSFILNNLNKINTKIIIILDDYHYISNELIHKGLEKFIINSKENISFIFSGRNKIPNVLSNLRFKFDLLEIDAESFLFTEDEIVGFFDKNNIKITEEQAKYIKNTNEGWILSLKTIILSILNNKKTLIPIEEISNNIKNKYIKGFLFDELLVNLDKSLVDFMMKTSILSYFNVKLCNNLLDISNASFFIEELEKKQLFFYTLDNQSNWYKYHDLFSQILSDKLKTENYSLYVDLCIKSAILFKENSDYDEAVKYAFLSNDYNFISSLLAELAPVFIGDSKILFLYELIEKIPREIIFSNTNLLSYYAFLLAIIYKIDYAKFIINEINKRDDLSENFKILNLLTNVIIYKVDNVNIKKINKSVDLILKNIHLFNKNIVPFVYYYLSRVCHFIYEINKSLILIDEAIINNNKINKNKNIYSFFYTYYNEAKARTLTLKGDLQEAEKLLKNTLAYLKMHNLLEHRTIFGIFGALMIIYSIKYDLKAFDEYKNKLLVLVEKEKVSINKFLAYGAICSAFIQLNKINESKNIIKIIDNLDLDINFKTNNICNYST